MYAHNPLSDNFLVARKYLEDLLSDEEPVFWTWPVITAFLRLTTGKAVIDPPLPTVDACRLVSSWLSRPNAQIVVPTADHWTIFISLVEKGQVKGDVLMDAHLATLCIEHGCSLATTDRDFAKFPGLKFFNPLEQ